jgi:ADP-heptose:LPS heptosyltransferase
MVMNKNNPKILIIMPNNPGDVLMACFALDAIACQNPMAELHFLIDEENASLLEDHPQLQSVQILPRKKLQQQMSNEPLDLVLEHTMQWITSIQDLGCDLCYNFFQEDYMSWLIPLLGIPEVCGKFRTPLGKAAIKDPWSIYLNAIPAARTQNTLHVVDIFCRIAGLNTYPCPRARNAKCALKLPFEIPQNAVLLQPGTAWPGKMWPLAKWKELTAQILQSKIFTPVFLGSKTEQPIIQEVISGFDPKANVIDLSGKTTLAQTLGLMQKASWLVSGDTFAMHAGAAMGIKQVALFGASNPIETGPYNENALVITHKSFEYVTGALPLDVPCESLQNIPSEAILGILLGLPLHPEVDYSGYYFCHKTSRMIFYGSKLPYPALPTLGIPAPQENFSPEITAILQSITELLGCEPLPAQQIDDLEQKLLVLTGNSLFFEIYRMELNSLYPDENYLPRRRIIATKALRALQRLHQK